MFKTRWLLLVLCSALTACGASPETVLPVTAASTVSVVSASVSPTIAPTTSTPIPSSSFTPTPRPTRYATRRPTSTATPTQIPPTKTPTIKPTSVPVIAAPPGLIYSANKGQWRIAANGKPTLIITGTNSLLSPNGQMAIKSPNCCYCDCDGVDQLLNLADGTLINLGTGLVNAQWSADSKYIYYASPRFKENLSDIWVYDVASGARRNLTNTPTRDEGRMLNWPPNAEFLAFYSTPGIPDGEGWIGYLTSMRTDGKGYQVISQRGVSSPAAFSPDGHTIAYEARWTLVLPCWFSTSAFPLEEFWTVPSEGCLFLFARLVTGRASAGLAGYSFCAS